MPAGRLITFEGIDGSGKSTQANLLYERLRREGISCAIFREPGGTQLGEQIRSILLDQHQHIGSFAELMLFSAARTELVRQIIRPLLARGCFVILDRFIDSTTAYQGYGRGIDLNLIESINRQATEGLHPDLTFLIDMETDKALNRLQRSFDRMEQEGISFLSRVREGYLLIAEADSRRFRVLNGSLTVEQLSIEVRGLLQSD